MDSKEPVIDVRIPWEPDRKLGLAFNRAMATVDDWALILDHDVYLCHPDWYRICQKAIEQIGHHAGVITCVTNAIGCPLQRAHHDKIQDMNWHVDFAVSRYEQVGNRYDDVTDSQYRLSGLFFLTRRRVWNQIGPIPDDKFIGLDNWYDSRCREAGFRTYVLPGLYVYHGYRRFWSKAGAK
jgi:GT2 family glycosyltransferase